MPPLLSPAPPPPPKNIFVPLLLFNAFPASPRKEAIQPVEEELPPPIPPAVRLAPPPPLLLWLLPPPPPLAGAPRPPLEVATRVLWTPSPLYAPFCCAAAALNT